MIDIQSLRCGESIDFPWDAIRAHDYGSFIKETERGFLIAQAPDRSSSPVVIWNWQNYRKSMKHATALSMVVSENHARVDFDLFARWFENEEIEIVKATAAYISTDFVINDFHERIVVHGDIENIYCLTQALQARFSHHDWEDLSKLEQPCKFRAIRNYLLRQPLEARVKASRETHFLLTVDGYQNEQKLVNEYMLHSRTHGDFPVVLRIGKEECIVRIDDLDQQFYNALAHKNPTLVKDFIFDGDQCIFKTTQTFDSADDEFQFYSKTCEMVVDQYKKIGGHLSSLEEQDLNNSLLSLTWM